MPCGKAHNVCGLCKKEVPEQPKITSEGTCSVCGAKLKPA
jgi:DNA-directed RNA polymerase subunit RPC12/RpoP